MAVAFAVVHAAAGEPTPAPATVKITLAKPDSHAFEHLQAPAPKAAARAGGKHRWKKVSGVLSHFPLLIWDDVRPPDEIMRYEGISSRPWTQIVGWHPGETFNENCVIHEPSGAIFTASK